MPTATIRASCAIEMPASGGLKSRIGSRAGRPAREAMVGERFPLGRKSPPRSRPSLGRPQRCAERRTFWQRPRDNQVGPPAAGKRGGRSPSRPAGSPAACHDGSAAAPAGARARPCQQARDQRKRTGPETVEQGRVAFRLAVRPGREPATSAPPIATQALHCSALKRPQPVRAGRSASLYGEEG